MEKAYDISDLVSKLKDAGLPIAEQAAGAILDKIILWIKESAALSKTPYDDMLLVLLPLIEAKIKEEIAKIDGK